MRILEIQIERFGAWQNLNLPMADGQLSVFFGPNEAGKTTLMRFVRGILFGFPHRVSDIWGEEIARLPRSGSLKVEEDELTVRLHRSSIGTSRGELTLTGLDQPRTAQDWLHDALRGVNEKLFENVYAIGLKELQELGSLTDEDVSGHIYGLSLGPEARRLLDSWHRVHQEKDALVDRSQTGGRLVELFARQDELLGQLATFKKIKPKYSALCQRRKELEAEIDELRDRQTVLSGNLRGLKFLAASWQPWRRIRHLEQELQTLPLSTGFPSAGFSAWRSSKRKSRPRPKLAANFWPKPKVSNSVLPNWSQPANSASTLPRCKGCSTRGSCWPTSPKGFARRTNVSSKRNSVSENCAVWWGPIGRKPGSTTPISPPPRTTGWPMWPLAISTRGGHSPGVAAPCGGWTR